MKERRELFKVFCILGDRGILLIPGQLGKVGIADQGKDLQEKRVDMDLCERAFSKVDVGHLGEGFVHLGIDIRGLGHCTEVWIDKNGAQGFKVPEYLEYIGVDQVDEPHAEGIKVQFVKHKGRDEQDISYVQVILFSVGDKGPLPFQIEYDFHCAVVMKVVNSPVVVVPDAKMEFGKIVDKHPLILIHNPLARKGARLLILGRNGAGNDGSSHKQFFLLR